MSPFHDPKLMKKANTTPLNDCSTCKNCVTPVNTTEVPIPFRLAMFCIKEKRYLMKYFSNGKYVTGIENAPTCPNYQKKG